jgi:hypothetical protein
MIYRPDVVFLSDFSLFNYNNCFPFLWLFCDEKLLSFSQHLHEPIPFLRVCSNKYSPVVLTIDIANTNHMHLFLTYSVHKILHPQKQNKQPTNLPTKSVQICIYLTKT